MPRFLPDHPNVETLKKEAKALLKSHRNGDRSACQVLKGLHRFEALSDGQILESKVSLVEMQFALAVDYGCKSWEQLISHVNYSKRKLVEKLNGTYRYTYCLDGVSNPDERFFPYSDLTLGEHARHQYHNELQSLLALVDLSWVPRVLEYDADALTMVVQDLGENQGLSGKEQLEPCLARIAELHDAMETRKPDLKRVWHNEVDESWYFAMDAKKTADLSQTGFREVLNATPALIALTNEFARRYAHGDPACPNLIWDGNSICMFDFQDAHIRHQLVDVVTVLDEFSWRGEFPTAEYWMKGWDSYASHRGDCENSDLTEFLYLSIRKTARRLAKGKPLLDTKWEEWMIERATMALRELSSLGTI